MNFAVSDNHSQDEVAAEAGLGAAFSQALSSHALPTPAWVAVKAEAFHRFAKGNALESFFLSFKPGHASSYAERLENFARESERRILGCSVSPEVSKSLAQALKARGLDQGPLLLRGSQFAISNSHTAVPVFQNDPIEVLIALRKVWASAFDAIAVSERLGQGGEIWPYREGVLIQRFDAPMASGIVDSHGPQVRIEGVFGALGAIAVDRDRFESGGGAPTVANKQNQFSLGETGFSKRSCPEPMQPCLTTAQVTELSRLAAACKQAFGRPQTLEWSFSASGGFSILGAHGRSDVQRQKRVG